MELLDEYTHNLLSKHSRKEKRVARSQQKPGSQVKGSVNLLRSLLELARAGKGDAQISRTKIQRSASEAQAK